MKGSYRVRISNRSLSYDFVLHRNITILKGNSATGKTTLVDMVREYALNGEDSAIQLSCERPCVVVEGNTWERQIQLLETDSIIFIDEGSRFVSSEKFAQVIQNKGHYYVIVTRESLYNLPYSITEIYGIRSSGKYNEFKPVYHEFYRIYPESNELQKNVFEAKRILVEDSNSGYQFFSKACRRDMECTSAKGNANILGILKQDSKTNAESGVLVIADGAAFGAYMAQIDIFLRRHKTIRLYLPESFEWMILKSGLIDGKRVEDILNNPEDYIDSKKYFSWERYFTDLLVKETAGSYLQYQKAKLNMVYLQSKEKNAIIKVIPDSIRDLFGD